MSKKRGVNELEHETEHSETKGQENVNKKQKNESEKELEHPVKKDLKTEKKT